MDNQFKNVKTHARLLSKAMWYEWRMKLLDGLKDGLVRISQDLNNDADLLGQQEQLLEEVLPALIEEHERLRAEAQLLQAQADEMADCDQEDLADARENLVCLDEELVAKRKVVAELQEQLNEQEKGIEDAIDRKQESLGAIREAERVREECRGWSGSEVALLKGMWFSPKLLYHPVLIILSQRRRPRASSRLDDRFCSSLIHHINLPLHSPALPNPLLFPRKQRRRRRLRPVQRQLVHQLDLHRRHTPHSPQTPLH